MGLGYDMYKLKTSVREPRYSQTGLQPSTTYRYLITVFDGQTESPPEAVAVKTVSWLRLPSLNITQATARSPQVSQTAGVPTGGLTASPTPQGAEVILGLMGTNDYLDELGNLHVVGEVHNDMPDNVDQIRVTLAFYGESGDVVKEITSAGLLDLLAPGQRTPFVIVWEGATDWERYSLRAAGRETTKRPPEGVNVLHSYARLDDVGLYHVVGTLRNEGTTTAYYVKIVVSLYDEWGRIENANFCYAAPSRIAPGMTASFDCPFEYYPYQATHLVQIAP
jgi:hypothetical protein